MGGADPTMDKIAKTNKPYAKLVEDAVLSLKEVESQLSDPFNKSKFFRSNLCYEE